MQVLTNTDELCELNELIDYPDVIKGKKVVMQSLLQDNDRGSWPWPRGLYPAEQTKNTIMLTKWSQGGNPYQSLTLPGVNDTAVGVGSPSPDDTSLSLFPDAVELGWGVGVLALVAASLFIRPSWVRSSQDLWRCSEGLKVQSYTIISSEFGLKLYQWWWWILNNELNLMC